MCIIDLDKGFKIRLPSGKTAQSGFGEQQLSSRQWEYRVQPDPRERNAKPEEMFTKAIQEHNPLKIRLKNSSEICSILGFLRFLFFTIK